MEYESVSKAAERMGVTVRTIQKWCKDGKIRNAIKDGRDWKIPINANASGKTSTVNNNEAKVLSSTPFLLTNGRFPTGKCLDFIESFTNSDEKTLVLGEYYYYIGDFEKSSQVLEPYLTHSNITYRCYAALVCAFANLSQQRTLLTDFSLDILEKQLKKDTENAHLLSPELKAIDVMVASIFSIQFHYPVDQIPPLNEHLKYLPDGLKLYACYLMAYKAYLNKDYRQAVGITNTALEFNQEVYNIPYTYLYVMKAVSLMNLLKSQEAKECLEQAWSLAKEDNIITPFVEHYGILQGLIEVCFKKSKPTDYQKIINSTKKFNVGWYKIHNKKSGRTVADNLTPTEFTIAMLYNRGWRIKEIANHIELSERTVKNYLQIIYEKLGISGKKELEKYMMH